MGPSMSTSRHKACPYRIAKSFFLPICFRDQLKSNSNKALLRCKESMTSHVSVTPQHTCNLIFSLKMHESVVHQNHKLYYGVDDCLCGSAKC